MAVTARTWVGGEVITAAKMNTIRDDLIFLAGLSVIKSVQHIDQVLALDENVETTITITAVVVGKTFLVKLEPMTAAVFRVYLASTTAVKVTSNSAIASVRFNIEVVEYN
jgi:hypothetical protein